MEDYDRPYIVHFSKSVAVHLPNDAQVTGLDPTTATKPNRPFRNFKYKFSFMFYSFFEITWLLLLEQLSNKNRILEGHIRL